MRCSVKLIWKCEIQRAFYLQDEKELQALMICSDLNAWNCYLHAEICMLWCTPELLQHVRNGPAEAVLSAITPGLLCDNPMAASDPTLLCSVPEHVESHFFGMMVGQIILASSKIVLLWRAPVIWFINGDIKICLLRFEETHANQD